MNTTYDALGRIVQEQENVAPNATTSFAYQSQNRTRTTDPVGNSTTHYFNGYDGPQNGDLIRIQQPMGVNTILHRDIWGKLTRVQQYGNHNGFNLNSSNYYYYDSRDRLCRYSTPAGGHTVYAYDNANQMTAYAKGVGSGTSCATPSGSSKVTLSYDAMGRNTLTNYSDTNTADISRTFDPNGNVLTLNRSGANWTYVYNNVDQLTSETLSIDGRTYASTYTYDSNGYITGYTLPSGRSFAQLNNGLGQVNRLSNGGTNILDGVTYHPNGIVSGATYGNGQVLSNTLNIRQHILRTHTSKAGAVAIDQTLGYDAGGKITSISDSAVSGNNRTYGYDGLGRLITATGPWGTGSYVYDPLGNLRQKKLGSRTVNLAYDNYNRVSQSADTGVSGTRALAYDARGNVTSLGSMAFVYDYADQPASVSGSTNGSYTYDGNLKRVKSVANGKTIYNVYNVSGKLVHIDAVTDNKKTDYVSGPNGTEARITNNVVTYLHPDHLGSAQSGTNTSGNVLWREQYTPYGEELQGPAANDDLAGFTGHIRDSATGLNYMQARYYDPVIGRFLSIDPIGFSADQPEMFNRYSYVGNAPTNYLDPTGKNRHQAVKNVGRSLDRLLKNIQKRKRAEQLEKNKKKGKDGEQETREDLGDDIAGEQVTLETRNGERSRTDFVTKDNKVVETKTGDAKLSPGQEKVKDAIDKGEPVIPRGKNAERAGLEPGRPVKMDSYRIDRPEE